ncbi:hypothetical protein DY000_02000642 [Brassica cretica]|uniref:AIG1-type G domain-containing protein n=1 Tax=Brassica cretica TaxID=69181 RepID=A0ABQ7CCV5_BRACR|nr:hypothetical protein DY000_02000642 [Brassica cretica]
MKEKKNADDRIINNNILMISDVDARDADDVLHEDFEMQQEGSRLNISPEIQGSERKSKEASCVSPASLPPAPPVLGLGIGAPLLKPTPRRRINGNVSQNAEDPTTTTDETSEKLQLIRVKFLRLSHRLGQTPRNVVVAQCLYWLGLPELSRGISSRVGALISINRAIYMAEQVEAAGGQDPLDFSCTIMLLGKTGVGKSATINSIFDDDHQVKKMCTTDAFQMGTNRVQLVEGFVQGIKVRVIDTPGLSPSWFDKYKNEKTLKSIRAFIKKSPPDVVLYLDRLDTQSIDDMLLFRTITHVLGPSIWSNAIVGLTHAASAPPDGAASSYDMFVTRRCHAIQQDIRQAAGDVRLVNPHVSLVENHPACRTNRAGQKVLPNGQAWKPHLLLLSFASKILAEANALLKLLDGATEDFRTFENADGTMLGEACKKNHDATSLCPTLFSYYNSKKDEELWEQATKDYENAVRLNCNSCQYGLAEATLRTRDLVKAGKYIFAGVIDGRRHLENLDAEVCLVLLFRRELTFDQTLGLKDLTGFLPATIVSYFSSEEHSFTRLLPVPADYSGGETHLIGYACMLNVGIGSVDIILIFSLHGMALPSGEASDTFTLWRFNHSPIEHGVGDVPTASCQPMFVDLFPKPRIWRVDVQYTDQQIVGFFISGLRQQEMKDSLSLLNPLTLAEAHQKALIVEAHFKKENLANFLSYIGYLCFFLKNVDFTPNQLDSQNLQPSDLSVKDVLPTRQSTSSLLYRYSYLQAIALLDY